MSDQYAHIRLRRGTAAEWTASEPQPNGEILRLGEPGYEKDTGKLKIGDGVTGWNLLPYFADGATISVEQIQDSLGNSFLVAGSGISLNYNDESDTLTISSSGGISGSGTSFQIGSIDLHNGGVQNAQILQFDNSSYQSVITGPIPPSGNNAQRLIIQGQRGVGGEGGDVYFWGGDSDINGGDIKIYAGDADSNESGYGGYVNIDGGNGYTQGGNVSISAGNSSTQGGNVNISAGYPSGNVNINTNAGTWAFNTDGTVDLPSFTLNAGLDGLNLKSSSAYVQLYYESGPSGTPDNYIESPSNNSEAYLWTSYDGTHIENTRANDGINPAWDYVWHFRNDGNLNIPGSITLPNYTTVATGTFDNGTGGNHGISLNCVVGYELNWQGGHLKSTLNNGENTYNILCDSAMEFPGSGVDNVQIDSTGITFSDNTTQTTAWTGTISSASITDFSSSVSGLLPVKNIFGGNGVSVSSVSGEYTISASGVAAGSAESILTNCFNNTGSTLSKGTVVYINGRSGNLPTVQKSIATNEAGSSKTYGILFEDITDNHSGRIIVIGALTNFDTNQFSAAEGSTLYLSPSVSGAMTATKPSAPDHLVSVGKIVRNHNNQGIIQVIIQNGFELQELHNVSISGVSDNQVLMYDSATSLWKNETLPSSSTTVVSLSYSSGITTNASAGDIFDITASGSLTLNNPTNSVNGKTLRWRISQDNTGNRSITLGNKFKIPSSASDPLPWSTSGNAMDILAATYHAGRDKWDIIAFVPGY